MRITQHPAGFLKILFTEQDDGQADRLHIWDADEPAGKLDIHQHRGDITSTIYAGVMREDLYTYHEDPNGTWERWTVTCYTDTNGVYHVDPVEKIRVTPTLVARLIREPGDTYTRPATDLHRITALETPLITRCTTGPTYMNSHYLLRKLQTV